MQAPEQAEFILAHGTEAVSVPVPGACQPRVEPRSLEQLHQLLEACAQLPKKPPMVVANPDVVTVAGGSNLIPM